MRLLAFGNIRRLAAGLSAQTGGFGQVQVKRSWGTPDRLGFVFKQTVAGMHVSLAQWRPNSSFKPNLLRYINNMADKACHVLASATQVGLTQALGAVEGLLNAQDKTNVANN